MPTTTTRQEAFRRLAQLEPRLLELMTLALNHHRLDEDYCANDTWHFVIKPRLAKLVGWDAESRILELMTCSAYECAADAILAALPDCGKNCGCL